MTSDVNDAALGTIHWSGMVGNRRGISGMLPIHQYPSGEPRIATPGPGVVVTSVLLRPSNMIALMGGLFFVDALQERAQSAVDLRLVLPFVPGARQDRLNDTGDFLFTIKSVAREINARHFGRVIVLDPHSDVTPALIDRCLVVHADDLFQPDPSAEYVAVISPDAGAEKRAGQVAKKLGLPLLHGWKARDVSTGQISCFGLEPSPLVGRMVVVDDICDGGGTFVGLAAVLHERGIRADLYTTHGIYSRGVDLLLAHYGIVYCTDSIVGDRPGAVVHKVCGQLMGDTESC